MKKCFILALVFHFCPFDLAVGEEKIDQNLKGWTVYSGDPDFDISVLEKKGVKDRKEVMREKGENPTKPYSFDICFNQLQKLFPKIKEKKLDIEDIQRICSRSLNLKEYVFIDVYKSEYDRQNLIEFRKRMNEIFSP